MAMTPDEIVRKMQELLDDPAYAEYYDELRQKKEEVHKLKELTLVQGSEEDQKRQSQLLSLKKYIEGIPLEFDVVNRVDEFERITNRYSWPQYLLIHAAAGYGKTRLLRKVKARLTEQSWLCIHIALSRERTYTIQEITRNILQQMQLDVPCVAYLEQLNSAELGNIVGSRILQMLNNSSKGAILIVDEIESLSKEVIEQWLLFVFSANDFLMKANPQIPLRMILAGRYHARRNSFPSKVEIMSLLPFDFPAINEVVDRFAAKNRWNMQPIFNQDAAANLMYLTGGHPAILIGILQQDYCHGIRLSAEKEYYELFVEPAIKDMEEQIPVNLRKALKELSIFRKYNLAQLEKILKARLITCEEDEALKLGSPLTKSYLVDIKSGFMQNDIMRRLFAIQLRIERGQDEFAQLCLKAKEIYESYLKETSYGADSVIIEALYQELQFVHYTNKQILLNAQQTLLTSFFGENGVLEKYLNILLQKREATDILRNFYNTLYNQEDWEFRFTVNFFMRQDGHYTDEPYQKLIQTVEQFIRTHP